MGVAVRASAPKQIPQGSSLEVHPLFAKGPDILQRILSFADSLGAARTCRDFLNTTNALIEREWRQLNLRPFPYIERILFHPPLVDIHRPKTQADLTKVYEGIAAYCTSQGNASLVDEARKKLKGGFLPQSFQVLEDAARQAESDRNLSLIWPRIAAALNIAANPMSPAEIKEWLGCHADEVAQIHSLDLSNLNLTMIPEEFSTLLLPNLTRLSLYNNRLKTLPNNFGANWNQLIYLGLNDNELTVLPDNFGVNWNHLEDLVLFGNQINALPNNFGANWNRLRELMLHDNQLSALPKNFGSNWPWWNDGMRRFEALNRNPILNPARVVQAIPRQSPPQNPLAAQPALAPRLPQNLPTRLHTSEAPAKKSLNALLSTAAIHIFSTALLSAFASYVFSSKIPLALGAVYLGHRYVRDY